jgi:signal transduction histidine kinase
LPPHAARADDQPAAGEHRRSAGLQRWFEERSIPAQTLLVGTFVVLLACGLLAWIHQQADHPTVLTALGTGMLAVVACAWLAHRTADSLDRIAAASRLLRRDDAPDDANIPLIDANAELRQATMRLRRMVEAARDRRLALLERTVVLGNQLQVRTHELSTLQDLSVGLATKTDMHELVDEALKALEQTLDYDSASVWSRENMLPTESVVLMGYRSADVDTSEDQAQSLLGMRLSRPNVQRYEQIERDRDPIIENNARQSLLSWLWSKVVDDSPTTALYRTTRAWMGVPLKFHDNVLGVLRVDHQEAGYFNPERARLLTAVCSQTALAMRHAQMLGKEREMAVVAERNRIARDLHDAVSQTLFASNVVAGTMARAAKRDGNAALRKQTEALERLNRGALAEMRMLMYELRPDALADTPLSELLQLAIEALVCRGDIQIDTTLSKDDHLPVATRLQLYRIAQEALSNIGKHSEAKYAVVQWQVEANRATLRIADDGRGFDPQRPRPGHFGLGNMSARAREIGARHSLTSAPGEGTELRIDIP